MLLCLDSIGIINPFSNDSVVLWLSKCEWCLNLQSGKKKSMSDLGVVFQMCCLACRPSLGEDADLQRVDLCVTGLLCAKSA